MAVSTLAATPTRTVKLEKVYIEEPLVSCRYNIPDHNGIHNGIYNGMRKARGAHPFLAVHISEKGHTSDTQNGGTKSDLVFLGFPRPTALKTIPREKSPTKSSGVFGAHNPSFDVYPASLSGRNQSPRYTLLLAKFIFTPSFPLHCWVQSGLASRARRYRTNSHIS